ncbi:MAG: MFS transporter [Alphaproteobacteria bacterium]|jgi:FSR family fosmidomycin resistance protein-like MFS transporter
MAKVTTAPASDLKVISLISTGHCLSHVYQLALPNLFFLITIKEGFSIAELAILTSVFFAVSAVGQVIAGFMVDKHGARPILFLGFFLMALSIAAFAFVHSYAAMMVLSFFAGLGNSVFHPADYSILNGSITEKNVGKAYGVHGFGGLIGYAIAPYSMYLMGTNFGWRQTMLVLGIIGLVVAALMWTQRTDLRDSGLDKGVSAGSVREGIGILFKPATIFSFLFFCFMAMGSVGLMTLGPDALTAFLDLSRETASSTISLQLTGSLCGILIGGMIADRIVRHDMATAGIVTIGVLLLWTVPAFKPDNLALLISIFIVYGFAYGMAQPSRDMVVRSVAPSGAAGKVFGFTYSGMDVGSAIAVGVFGYLLGGGQSQLVFILVGAFMMVGVGSVLLAKVFAKKKPIAA